MTDWEYEYNRLVNSALKLNDIVNHLVAELEIRKGVAKVRQDKIDKAIEYIENNSLYEQDYDYDYEENLIEYPPNDEKATKELLDILRGEDKE